MPWPKPNLAPNNGEKIDQPCKKFHRTIRLKTTAFKLLNTKGKFPGLTHKYCTWLKSLSGDKHSSLFARSVSDDEKRF